MTVARLCKTKYLDLKGTGSQLYGGRWTSPGRPAVYTAESGALAILEYAVHMQELPSHLSLVRIEIPETLEIESVQLVPGDLKAFQQLGDEWLERAETSVLRVPSVLVPNEHNYLINPLHPHAGTIQIIGKTPYVYDRRLLAIH